MLIKQGIDVSFAQGLDTKTDKKRVTMGKFLKLENTIFQKGGLLQKRNGYGTFPSLPGNGYTYLTTFSDNLTAIGSNIAAYNQADASWVGKGSITPISITTLPVIRNNLNQQSGDIAVAPNGLACVVYTEVSGITTTNNYAIFDSVTGQNIVNPTVIPVASGTVTGGMRVFILGNNFILMFTNVISGTAHLQYVAISIQHPTTVGANTDIASSYVPSNNLSFDGYVFGNFLYIAYDTTTGGQSVKVTILSKGLTLATATSFSGRVATIMSVTVDITDPANPVIWVSFFDSGTSTGYTLAVNQNLNTLLGPTQIISSGAVRNITSAAQNNVNTVVYETSNTYSYDATINSNFLTRVNISITGSVGSSPVVIRSLGLASKAFINQGTVYVLGTYSSLYQPTYFLINATSSISVAPIVAAKLAYENGGGYSGLGLPSVSVFNDNKAMFAYFFKDLIAAVNKGTNVPVGTQVDGVYSQTGINLGTFLFTSDLLTTAEIGNDLHISGGFLGMYDGFYPVEHNFFLYPDNVEATWLENSEVTPTGTFSSGATTVVVSSPTGVAVGMTITDTSNSGYIPTGTIVTGISGSTLTISQATTNSASGDNLSILGHVASGSVNTNAYYYQVTYEWTDNRGNAFRSAPSIPISVTTTGAVTTGTITLNIPTLRVTMKTNTQAKIVIYRWSVTQQNYFQVTSITSPIINNSGVDSVSFVDTSPDANILGNNLIYTTGGVVEDINAPGTNSFGRFVTRLWLVDAEDPNLLYFSKQVIEATPVEMSDLFTFYVPPTAGTQTSTGPITSLYVMDDKLIIGKKNALVYINGSGPDNTGGNSQYSQPIFITSTVGCSNQRSLVLIPQGLVFQSDKGIWLLDRGLNTSYIGAPVEDLTTGATVLSAVSIPETNQVRFILDTGITLMYDYFYDQWGSFTGVPAISSCIYQDLHTYINSHGAAYQETDDQYLDGSNPVLMSFKTGPLRLAELQSYQRAYFFYLLGTYISPHKLQVLIGYDYSESPSQSVVISPTNYSTPYGSGPSQSPYGQGTPYGGPGTSENWRIFLARQRCMAFDIEVIEVFDPSFGTSAGAGLTLSGINVVVALKQKFRPQPAAHSVG